MLCTRCGQPIVPVVAVDIDGTLGDYHGHLTDFARLWLGVEMPWPLPHYEGEMPFREWFTRTFNVDVTTFRQIKLAYRQGGMKRSMPIRQGAQELLGGLNEQAEVWLTTTRPWNRYDRVDPDTREWLRRNKLVGDALLFGDDKLADLMCAVDRRRVAVVLDDESEVLALARERRLGRQLLARTRYNRKATWAGIEATDLHDALPIMLTMIEEWRAVWDNV